MPKAKTIDRLALTKRNSAFLRDRDDKRTHKIVTDISPDNIPPDIDIHALGDVCPNCGQLTIVHESDCVKCPSCAWSACG